MKATFDKTVSILVKAYLNGDLLPGWPCGCAVGNLIADKCDYEVELFYMDGEAAARWKDITDEGFNWYYIIRPERKGGHYIDLYQGFREIEATGYTQSEIELIERAFEKSSRGRKERMFYGLMSVVDVLADIHSVDLSVKEEAKQLFVKV